MKLILTSTILGQNQTNLEQDLSPQDHHVLLEIDIRNITKIKKEDQGQDLILIHMNMIKIIIKIEKVEEKGLIHQETHQEIHQDHPIIKNTKREKDQEIDQNQSKRRKLLLLKK